MLLLKEEKRSPLHLGKTPVSTEKGTESKGDQESESQNESNMDIESENESQDTNFSEDGNESHDPKQSSKAPVKDSLKVSDWVVVKYDIAGSSKSKSSIQHFVDQILEVISDAVFRITFVRPQYSTDMLSTNGQVVMMLTLVTLIILMKFFPNPK